MVPLLGFDLPVTNPVPAAEPLSAGDVPMDIAPTDVQSLLDAGGVLVETYDPAVEESDMKNYHGSTMFEVGFAAPFRSEFAWKPDGKWKRVTVKTAFQPTEVKMRLKIKVPEQTASESESGNFWHGSLIRHELDHVAICTDPRTLQIFDRTLRSLNRLELKLSAKLEPRPSRIVGRVERQMQLRREAIYNLIRRQNQKLDDLTRNGDLAVADRDIFFRGLVRSRFAGRGGVPFSRRCTGSHPREVLPGHETAAFDAGRGIGR